MFTSVWFGLATFTSVTWAKKQTAIAPPTPLGQVCNTLILLINFGAGEANRTPDPNLGKVMLYP